MFKGLIEEVDSYFSRDPSAKSRLEIFLCYPGLHAILFHKISHKLWNAKWHVVARVISQMSRFFTGIEIHPSATIGKRLFLDHGMGVVIGETATIGNDVTIYHGVTLGGTSVSTGIRHPQVGNNVIIGSGAQILGPVSISDGARIGSNAVVVKDVESNTSMVGVPARPAKNKAKKDNEDFTAYGTAVGEDSRQVLIDRLLKEMEVLQARVKDLESDSDNIADTADRWESNQS